MNVRFLADDPRGLWKKDDVAEDWGWESDHPAAPPIRLLRLHGEFICLTDPFERGHSVCHHALLATLDHLHLAQG